MGERVKKHKTLRKKPETKKKYAYLLLISQFLGFYRSLLKCVENGNYMK
jgi:hypothetical protein